MESHEYEVSINWLELKKGTMKAPGINEHITVATPPEFNGGMHGIWSPEHLFTAAVNSCFMTTFLAVAEFSKFEYIDFECKSRGILTKADGRYAMTHVELEPTLTVSNEEDREKAERILVKAEKACLISNSIKSTTSLKINIQLAAKPVEE
ncbi:MAG: OsmC family protein [Bacteroidia bacterium]|jgi:peroxiredoxin-like protein